VRISDNGEFIHENPNTVADQGVDNVSHGCINLSPANAQAYFDSALVGGPVEITGTSVQLSTRDGDVFDYTVPWSEWQNISALQLSCLLAGTPRQADGEPQEEERRPADDQDERVRQHHRYHGAQARALLPALDLQHRHTERGTRSGRIRRAEVAHSCCDATPTSPSGASSRVASSSASVA